MNHILLVEDDESHAELISHPFESRSEQFNLTIVCSIKEAKEHLTKYIPDLVIADYVLQDGKGIELIPASRDKSSYPVVIITSQGNEQVAVDAMKAGALDYVVKLEDTITGMTHICERALREWDHILERKRLEESLKKSEEKYRKLIKTANDAIFIADAKTGIIIDANKRAEELIGLPLEKIVGMHQKQLHPEEEAEQYKKLFDYYVLNGNTISEELFVCNKDGFKIPVEISSSVLELNGKRVIQGIFRDITKRNRLEEQLQKLSCAVEQSPSTVMITDVEGNIEYVNPKFKQLTGYTCEEVIGQNPRILKSGKTPTNTYKELWEYITTGKDWRGEFCNKKKNGELYWESASISPIKDNKGIITHFVGVKEDITKRKQAEEELVTLNASLENIVNERTVELKNINEELQTEIAERKRMEEYLKFTKFAVDNNSDATYWVKSDGRISYVNHAACQALGYTKEELVSMSVPDIDPDFPQQVWPTHWQEMKEAGSMTFEAHHKTKDGRVFPVEILANYLKYNKEEYICAYVRDITERKLVEETLLESEEKYRQVISTAKDAIMIFDVHKKKFIEVNKACEGIYGYKREEFLNISHIDITNEPEESESSIRKAAAGKLHSIPLRYHRKKNGTVFPVEISVSTFVYKGRKVLCGIIRDITERKKAEEQIRASLKEKEVLLNEIHHRVKNNLQIISSFLDLSSMETGDQNTIDLFTDCRNRIDSMAIIHSQLYKSDRFDQIDMGKHTQELSKRLLQIYAMDKPIELDIKCNDVCLAINQAVPCALILNELISNALKHAYCNKEKGTLCISIQKLSNGNLTVSVKDDGAGIPEELDIDRSRTLGLTLVRNLVRKQLKGNIQVLRNGGTEFIIDFKALEDKEE